MLGGGRTEGRRIVLPGLYEFLVFMVFMFFCLDLQCLVLHQARTGEWIVGLIVKLNVCQAHGRGEWLVWEGNFLLGWNGPAVAGVRMMYPRFQ